MSDWASTAHLPTSAVCDECPHTLALHDGEHQECRLCVCDGFVVSAEDAAAMETMEPLVMLPPDYVPMPKGASAATRARNLEHGRTAKAEALALIARAQSRKKAG